MGKTLPYSLLLATISLGGVPAIAQQSAEEFAEEAAEAAGDAVELTVSEAVAEDPYYPVGAYPSDPYPANEIYDVIRPSDYPPEAWREDMEGMVGYQLSVDADGSVGDCTITESSGHELLDTLTCRFAVERYRFEPARDEDGNPVAGTFFTYADWQKREPEFENGFRIRVRFAVDESGEVQNCETLEVSENLPAQMARSFEREPCPGSRSGVPYRDAEGNPVAREVELSLIVEVSDPQQ